MKRLLRHALLVISIGILASCSKTLSPAYTPAGLLRLNPTSTPKVIRLRTIDEIQSTVPLSQMVSALERANITVVMVGVLGPVVGGLAAATATPIKQGDQLVCPTCAYQLKETPVNLMHDMATSALAKVGITIAEGANRKLDLRILRFDIIAKSTRRFSIEVRILMRAEVRENGQTLADVAILETATYDGGHIMSKGELEDFVGKTASRAVERILGESQVSTALFQGL